jgi:hypothetical protein
MDVTLFRFWKRPVGSVENGAPSVLQLDTNEIGDLGAWRHRHTHIMLKLGLFWRDDGAM